MFNKKEIEYMHNDIVQEVVSEIMHNAKINMPVSRRLDCKNSDESFTLFVDFRVELMTQYSTMTCSGVCANICEFYANENIAITLTFENDSRVKQITVIRKPEAKYVTLYLKIFE